MVARVVGRSRLTGLRRNGGVFHVLMSAANEDAEQYFQFARLRELFSVERATGSDLDERAEEFVFDDSADINRRIAAQKATTTVIYTRQGTTGTIPVPQGSFVGATDLQGQILFQTTAAGSVLAGNTSSAAIPAIAVEAGTRANVAAGAINRMVSRIAGLTGVSNPAKVDNGLDRELDGPYKARLKRHVQSLSRGTDFAVESAAANTSIPSGERVRFARIVSPVIPNGTAVVYIDDGTGSLDTYSDEFLISPDTLILSAVGGEERTQLSKYAVRDDGSFVLQKNAVSLTRGVDYFLNRANGAIEFATPLVAADSITAYYRHYTGLVAEAQAIISGKPEDRVNYPGWAETATEIRVLPAVRALQTVSGAISVMKDYDGPTVIANAKNAIQTFINSLDVGAAVLASRIIEKVMAVEGVENFKLLSLTGSSPAADQIILQNQAARILSAGISLV